MTSKKGQKMADQNRKTHSELIHFETRKLEKAQQMPPRKTVFTGECRRQKVDFFGIFEKRVPKNGALVRDHGQKKAQILSKRYTTRKCMFFGGF